MSDLASPSIASEPAYLELTFRRVMCIWWAYFWRHMLYGGVAVLVISFLEGLAGLVSTLKHHYLKKSSMRSFTAFRESHRLTGQYATVGDAIVVAAGENGNRRFFGFALLRSL